MAEYVPRACVCVCVRGHLLAPVYLLTCYPFSQSQFPVTPFWRPLWANCAQNAKALRCLELRVHSSSIFVIFSSGCVCVCCAAVCVCVCLAVTCSCCCWVCVWRRGGFVLLPAAENKSKLLWHIIFIAQHFGRAHFYCQLRYVLCSLMGYARLQLAWTAATAVQSICIFMPGKTCKADI